MQLKIGACFVFVVILAAVHGQEVPTTTPRSTTPPSTTTEPSTTTSSTTPAPTTSSTTPSTTTTTTTPAPTTSTPAPTTSTPAPTPTTTTVEPPTTPLPPPTAGTWIIANKTTNVTCIMVQMAIQLNVTYPAGNVTKYLVLDMPADNTTVADGACSNVSQVLNLTWPGGNSLVLTFTVNATTRNFDLSSIAVNLNSSQFPGANASKTVTYEDTNPLFSTPLEMSYKCDKVQQLNLTSADPAWKGLLVLSISKTQLEAFRNTTSHSFGAAQDCDAFDTPDVVPIAVGCALAILVLVVLTAYLIGRRRSQNHGYLSM